MQKLEQGDSRFAKSKNTRIIVFVGVQIIVAIGTAILLPLVFFQSTAASREFSTASQTIIAILAAMLVILVPMPILIRQASVQQDDIAHFISGERVHLASLDIVTTELLRIQTALPHVQAIDPANLFGTLINEEISSLAERVEECARKSTLEIWPSYQTTDPLLRAVTMGEDGECNFFHYTDNQKFFLDPGGHSLDFQDKLHQAVRIHRLATIKRLLIVGSQAEAAAIDTWLLGLFYRDCPGYDYRVISRILLDVKRTELRIRRQRVDVGIYNSKYVYISDQAPDATDPAYRMQPNGLICSDPSEVRLYLRLFREAWVVGRRLPSAPIAALGAHLRGFSGGRGAGGTTKLNSFQRLNEVLRQPPSNMRGILQNTETLREFDEFVSAFTPGRLPGKNT